MTHTENIYFAPCNKKGNQTNEWRIKVFHAVRVEGWKVAYIEKIIRKEKGASGWDGIGHTDKQFNSLNRRVEEALEMVEAEDGINLDQLEYMSYNKSEKVIKNV